MGVVGIDLGTTNSVVAILEGGQPVVIANAEGLRTTPSIVAYTKKGELLVGQIAKRQAVINPENTFFSAKRFIGSKATEMPEGSKQLPYKVIEDEKGNIKLECSNLGKNFSPEEISAQVLRKLVNDASTFLGQTITEAVITVPAYFNDSQRQATKDAGRIAGLDVLRIINEPTAASLAYGLDKNVNETVLVFDLGGGTFDVSILEVGDGVFEVLSTSGDTSLGGDDFDKMIVDWLMTDFEATEGIDLRQDSQALQRLTEAAEKAKFEDLCDDLIHKCRIPVENSIRDARIDKSKIDQVVLVGGSSRIPAIQKLVTRLTGKEPNQTVNPDEVVAVGAAIQGGVLAGEVKDILLLDVTPLSLGVETLGGVMTKIIARNTTIPTKKAETFSTAVDNQTNVEVHALQGEREFATDNKSLGNFRLDGIPLAQRGVPQIKVTFDIDANGLLSVNAKEQGTGQEQSITIQGASTLDENEVQDMINKAEQYAQEDKERREKIDLKNQADSFCYESEKRINELGDAIDNEQKETITSQIKELRSFISNEEFNNEELKTKMNELSQLMAQFSNTETTSNENSVEEVDFVEE